MKANAAKVLLYSQEIETIRANEEEVNTGEELTLGFRHNLLILLGEPPLRLSTINLLYV